MMVLHDIDDLFQQTWFQRTWFQRIWFQRTWFLSSVLLVMLTRAVAGETVYYVSPAGSNSNSGWRLDAPLLTINAALGKSKPGDTVLVLPGTYRESVENAPGGTSWDAPIRLAAYDPDRRPVLQPPAGANRVLTFAAATSSYFEVDGFIMDATNVSFDGVKITHGAGGASHDIRIKNSVIKHAPRQGVLTTGARQGVRNLEFSNLEVQDNGTSDFDHGFYVATPLTSITNSRIQNNTGWGIHNYGQDPSHNAYLQNIAFDNGRADRGAGIGIYNGDGILVGGNITSGNRDGIVVQYGALDVIVDHNITAENQVGIRVTGTDVRGTVVSNNLSRDNLVSNLVDTGADTRIIPFQPSGSQLLRWDSGQPIAGTAVPAPGIDLSGQRLSNVELVERDLSGASFRAADLRRGMLSGANLTGVDFRDARLADAILAASTLGQADLSGAVLSGAALEHTTQGGFTMEQLATTASYQQKDLSHIQWSRNDLSGWKLADQDLNHAAFFGADLSHADLSRADLSGAALGSSYLGSATLANADFSDARIGKAKLEGITAGGFTRDQFYSTANYKERTLQGINLSDNDLSQWNLDDQWLTRATLRRSQFVGGSLRNAHLALADLLSADLTNADLRGADLTASTLRLAKLKGADLTDAVIANAVFDETTSSGFSAEQLYSTKAYQAKDLRGLQLRNNNLAGWNFQTQQLGGVSFAGSQLTDASFSDAVINGARFENTTSSGFTANQLYSTASYASQNLRGVSLADNDLAGWSFQGQDLTSASLQRSTLSQTEFRDAIVAGSSFDGTTPNGFTSEQLYSTASYKNRDLSQIRLSQNDLRGWNLADQRLSLASLANSNLTGSQLTRARLDGASLSGATLADTDLSAAIIRGANLSDTTSRGLTAAQFYSTADYQIRELSGIQLGRNDLRTWDFADFDLTGASLVDANLGNAKLSGANLRGADLSRAILQGADVTDAIIDGAILEDTVAKGFTKEQLYRTASYQRGELPAIHFASNDLSNWNFANQDLADTLFEFDVNLQGANFRGARLSGTNFGGAKLAGADFSGADISRAKLPGRVAEGFAAAQLYATASYQNRRLKGVDFDRNDLTGWDFSRQDLTESSFDFSVLRDANFSGASLSQVSLVNTTSRGFTRDALYSSASYAGHDLVGIDLSLNDLSEWDLADQDLRNASFVDTQLYNTDLRRADLRGATGLESAGLTSNAILPDGTIRGLSLGSGETLVIRDDARRIEVMDEFSMRDGGRLRLLFDDDHWQSTIALQPTSSIELGGVLELVVQSNAAELVGTTFDLFDWPNTPASRFDAVLLPRNTEWDLSQLYTTGEVRFLSASVAGDYNNSGMVEQGDLDLVLLHWGEAATPPPSGWFNDLPDTIIDQNELDQVLLHWGEVTAVALAAVPEPHAPWISCCVAAMFYFAFLRPRTP